MIPGLTKKHLKVKKELYQMIFNEIKPFLIEIMQTCFIYILLIDVNILKRINVKPSFALLLLPKSNFQIRTSPPPTMDVNLCNGQNNDQSSIVLLLLLKRLFLPAMPLYDTFLLPYFACHSKTWLRDKVN